jgi:hypothetical protein
MTRHRLGLFSLTIFPALGLAAYGYLGNFTRMLADDFCSIGFANRLGLLRSIWFWYLNWSGRYTAFATDWLILKNILGPYKLHYFVPFTIIIWLGVIFFTVYLYLEKKHPSALLHAAALAVIFLFLVFLLTTDISQSLFWWNGMRSYALPLVVISVYFLLFQIYKRLNLSLLWVGPLAFILFFISGGLGETFVVAQIGFLVLLIGLDLLHITDRPRNEMIVFYASLAGTICSLLTIILSPGNRVRQSQLPPSPDIITLLTISLHSYGKFLADFFRVPAKILGLVGAILASIWIGTQYKWSDSSKRWQIPAYILGGLLISFSCFPPGVYGYSEPPPSRINIIPAFFLMAGVLFAGFTMGSWLAGREGYRWLDSVPFIVLTTLFIGISSLITIAYLFGKRSEYIRFAEKWDQVDAQIVQARAKNLKSVSIPAMNNWAGLEWPTDNKNYWPTQCYSLYYGIQVVGPPYSE